MAFPQVQLVTEYALTSDGDPAPTFQQTTGHLVLIYMALPTPSQTISLPAGWTNLTNANTLCHIFWKVLDGSEGGSVQVTLATNKRAAAIAFNLTGYDNAGANPDISSFASGTSVSPDTAALNPAGGAKDFLFFTGFSRNQGEEDDDTWVTAAPTNYGNLVQKTSGSAGGNVNCGVAVARRELNAGGSENPGAFTLAVSELWLGFTVAVHPGTGGPVVSDQSLAAHVRRRSNARLLRM